LLRSQTYFLMSNTYLYMFTACIFSILKNYHNKTTTKIDTEIGFAWENKNGGFLVALKLHLLIGVRVVQVQFHEH
jgi:hypothetical protein